MDYTHHGVLDTQMLVTERLGRILAEHGMVLDPKSPPWFDGRLELPTPGEPPEVVSARLRRAVDALRPPKPQEPGLA